MNCAQTQICGRVSESMQQCPEQNWTCFCRRTCMSQPSNEFLALNFELRDFFIFLRWFDVMNSRWWDIQSYFVWNVMVKLFHHPQTVSCRLVNHWPCLLLKSSAFFPPFCFFVHPVLFTNLLLVNLIHCKLLFQLCLVCTTYFYSLCRPCSNFNEMCYNHQIQKSH